jgi:hypothetical protein
VFPLLNRALLTLLIGPAIPVPAPPPVIEALQSVQVTNGKTGSGFQLTFTVGQTSLIQLALLPAGYFDPMITRVIVIVTVNGVPNVLMDGMITRQELTMSNEAGQSKLTITGEDLSVLMGVVEKKFPYPAFPDIAQVAAILAPYALFGIIPLVIPPLVQTVRTQLDQWPTQTGTDLEYVRGLAGLCGYVFMVEPGPLPYQSIAYFGPPYLPVPQRALSINVDSMSNIEGLSFSLDGLAKKLQFITIFDPITGKIPLPVPIPNINPLRPPLGLRPMVPSKVEFSDDFAGLPVDEAAKRVFGIMVQMPPDVSGSGSLDVMRYGQILRSGMLVGVRGAGLTYDGMYYVESVTHDIKRGSYKQSFTFRATGSFR